MPRKKITSTNAKKERVKLKRAVKRGDAVAPVKDKPVYQRPGASGPPTASTISAKKLESRFQILSKEYIETSKRLASTVPLARPIPSTSAHFPVSLISDETSPSELVCPKRPKWKYDQTKKEVEKNEAGLFDKWRKATDLTISKWVNEDLKEQEEEEEDDGITALAGKLGKSKQKLTQMEEIKEVVEIESKHGTIGALRSTTYFERNLEVWRQLWRVTEISQIILILLDVRCPPLHFPPSLQDYCATLNPPRPVILVLTKCDMVTPEVADEWQQWCEVRWNYKVVKTESYKPLVLKQGHTKKQSHLPPASLGSLIIALKEAHHELLNPSPPTKKRKAGSPSWAGQVRETVDWRRVGVPGVDGVTTEGLMDDDDDSVGDQASSSPPSEAKEGQRLEHLTIGLIGQPNVGKSSLLNAMVGQSKVRASKTAGKTKHLQTIFWSKELRLADCPGLVFPNYVPYELQSLSSILMISSLPALPGIIRLAGGLMPLEKIMGLKKSEEDELEANLNSKRTWRAGMPQSSSLKEESQWTAMEIMEAWATERGFLTAKAGRPDHNRAGNYILRAIAEGRIRWAFRPPLLPDSVDDSVYESPSDCNGIWLGVSPKELGEDQPSQNNLHHDWDEESLDEESGGDDHQPVAGDNDDEEDVTEEDDEEDEEKDDDAGMEEGGMFGALAIEGGDGSDDDEDDDELEEEEDDDEADD